MTSEDDTEMYLNAELDKCRVAVAHSDEAGARRVLEHVRAKVGDDVLVRMLAERALSNLLTPPVGPPAPPAPPTQRPAKSPDPGSNKRLVTVLATTVAVLTVAVVVLVVVEVTRPSTKTAETAQPQVTTSVVAPPIPPAGETTTASTVVPPPTMPGYQLAIQNQPLTLGAPALTACQTVVDLDIPAVKVNATSTDSTDLGYERCTSSGLSSLAAKFFGNAPTEQPASAEQCATSARTDTVTSSLETKYLIPGKSAFCVVTHGGNVAWLRLADEVNHDPYYPDLTFDFTLWKRVPPR